jgi:hypothetical protein
MAAHGRSVRRSGATPTATSQLQLKATPATTATAIIMSQNLLLPRIKRLLGAQAWRGDSRATELAVPCVMVLLNALYVGKGAL